MLRTLLPTMLLALALPLPAPSRAQSVEEIEVGGATVRIELPQDHLRLGQRLPGLVERMGKLLPPGNALVEVVFSESDFERTLGGEPPAGLNYQIQVMESVREMPVSAQDWTQIKPMLIRQLGALDSERLRSEVAEHVGEGLETMTGKESSVSIGAASAKPVLYGDDPRSVRFSMVLPVEVKVGDKVRRRQTATAAVVTVVSRRMLFFYAYQPLPEGAPADASAARAALDAFVERVYRLNP